jgi:hypothetical protein
MPNDVEIGWAKDSDMLSIGMREMGLSTPEWDARTWRSTQMDLRLPTPTWGKVCSVLP